MPSERDDPDNQDILSAFGPLSKPSASAVDRLLHLKRATNDKAEKDKLTEAAHAQRFANHYGLDLRYDHRRKMWLFYDPPLWRLDFDGRITRAVIDFAKLRGQDAMDTIVNKEEREKAVVFAIRQEGVAAINRIISVARDLEPLADKGLDWDTDLWLAGAPNGVIDLKSGLLRDGDPADKISMSLRVPYDETATPPTRWLSFMREIFDGDDSLIEFVQRYVGYCLTGSMEEQALAIFHGRGANGKSTFLNTLSWLFGDYAYNMPFSAVELKQRASIPSDMAALAGKRFITSSETNDGTRFNEARLKALTGGDPITARFMYADLFTFQPVGKFILSVNHRPRVLDDSHGFWRRIRLVPFTRCFSGSQCDPNLDAKLKFEGPGILRWAIEGCLKWQEHKLGENAQILAATEEYKQESDPLADFIEESCELDAESVVTASEALAGYNAWAERQKLPKLDRLGSKDFGRRFSEKFERRRDTRGLKYYGVRIVSDKMW